MSACPLPHDKSDVCAACKLNCCTVCAKPAPLDFRTGMKGWTCGCDSRAPLDLSTPPASPLGRAAAVSIDISRESEEPKFPENFGHWSKRSSEDDDSTKILLVVDRMEIQQVNDLFARSIEDSIGEVVRNYTPDRFFDPRPKIVEIKRIENPVLLECFKARVKRTEQINKSRPESKRFDGSPVVVRYHGTSALKAKSIMQTGFNVQYSQVGLYGPGIYCSSDPRVARAHCTPDADGLCYMLCCRVNEGRKKTNDDFAGEYDSNGSGKCITVVPSDADIYAEYLLVIKEVSENEGQVKKQLTLKPPALQAAASQGSPTSPNGAAGGIPQYSPYSPKYAPTSPGAGDPGSPQYSQYSPQYAPTSPLAAGKDPCASPQRKRRRSPPPDDDGSSFFTTPLMQRVLAKKNPPPPKD